MTEYKTTNTGEALTGLSAQVEDIRTEIANTLLEIDQIVLQINPQIEADYAVKIGCYENELLQAQIAARRAKRKLALAQARVNRGEVVVSDALEVQLDAEFEAWEIQLDLQIKAYVNKLEARIGSRALTPGEAEELRSLHRELVKRLHADLHPGQTDEEARLFFIAQSAFEHGDLNTLRSIEVATTYLAKKDNAIVESANELNAELELLSAQLRITQERLEVLKNSAPYILAEKLASSEWVHARVAELKAQIAEQQEVRDTYISKFQELMAAQNA